tara:strand:- start:4277 stop:5032 length:756 start_codon:yes stop_codon:yes gene_type:complete
MDKKIESEIECGFELILDIRSNVKVKIEQIEKIKNTIKENYIEFIQKESKHYFGLDSVHFQNKLIELEYTNILQMYNYINNRIYGDYYKLFMLMKSYLEDKLTPSQYNSIKEFQKKAYPIYKDLDVYKPYDFDIINNIHQDVIHIIKIVEDFWQTNEETIKQNQTNLYSGINIDNYIINQQHMNEELYNTNNLYKKYINVYHKFHNNVLNNFLEKINIFFNQINIHIEESNSSYDSNFHNECDEIFDYIED